ncbi:MAG: putative DNA-binding domain-containing protein [Acidobacteriaceae bacterium]|nr:putative DNA-binding domain-containing protein [Acidobacteriaceae bacterium]MBV9766760.1 putative DNA-binding domain-containing protein [Acidobacteriaceae bacterium]
MSQLRFIQRHFSSLIMQPQSAAGTLPARTVDGRVVKREAEGLIKPNRKLSSFERLEIYHQQYWLRILSAITEDFPGLQAVVGARKFEQLVRAYLFDCPSTSFTLRNLGSQLHIWLLWNRELAAPFDALALDMVRLEWAHIEAFDAGAAPPLTLDEITTAGENLALSLQPCIRLLTLEHAVDDLLLEVRALEGAPMARKRVRHYAARPRHSFLIVHRVDGTVFYKEVQREAYNSLIAIKQGKSLEQAIAAAFASSLLSSEEQLAMLQECFRTWGELGWLCTRDMAGINVDPVRI